MNNRILPPNFRKFAASTGKPKTPEEWNSAFKLYRQMGYEMLIAFGTPPQGAEVLADMMFSGKVGMATLEAGFDVAERYAKEAKKGVAQ